jgi:hypothetical protein
LPLKLSYVDDELTGCKMLHLSKQSNYPKGKIERDNLEKPPSNWLPVSSAGSCLIDFPKLQEDDLRKLTLGVHQLKLEKSHTIEHQNADDSYEMFFFNKHDPMKTYFWERFKVVIHQVEHISVGLSMIR